MAKLTAKFRVGEYSTSENHFHIHFQLRSAPADGFEFSLVYDEHSFRLTDAALFYLSGLGYDTDLVTGEALAWLYMPRTKFGGWSWNEVLWRRVEVGMQADAIAAAAEKERRGKVAVERIIAEAPCLDWAMSVTEKLVDEPDDDTPWNKSFKFLVPERSDMTFPDTYFSTLLDDDSPTTKALQQSMKSVGDRIAVMEAAGLGEQPVHPLEEIAAFNRAINVGSPSPTTKKEALFYTVFHPGSAKREVSIDNEEGKYQYRRKIADDRTEKAVNAIHTHARRFLTPMSMREHDFLRSIIREEIKRVVGGVL